MTEEDTITLGTYAEELLSQELFGVLSNHYELQCFQHWAMTPEANKMEREHIFAKLRGTKDFLGHIAAYVHQKNEILEKRNNAPSPEDAPIDGID